MPRVRIVNVDDRGQVDAAVVECALSWMTPDLKKKIELKSGDDATRVANLYSMGRKITEDALIVSLAGSVTWTPKANTFRVIEGDTLRTLIARSEASRLDGVLNSLNEVNACLELNNLVSKKADEGSGGTYFLQTIFGNGSRGSPKTSPQNSPPQYSPRTSGGSPHHQYIMACFKPRNEEPGSKLNPREAQRRGVLPGEAAERECAAFLLDWGGFCGVPSTLLVEAPSSFSQNSHSDEPVIGSFQTFVQNAGDTAGDLSPHLFPAREVHKIGILDLRLLNMDRNDANILVTRVSDGSGEYKLIPIDHALCFPDRVEVGWCDWVWWDWPQTLIPFDRKTCEWVAKIDVEADAKILERFFGMRPACIRAFRCSSMLLKKGVAAGLNLHEIASVIVRSGSMDEPSTMEHVISRAKELATMMNSDSRSKANDAVDTLSDDMTEYLRRPSALDGLIHDEPTLKESNAIPDSLFFSYVDRLLDDVVAEVGVKKTSSYSSLESNSFNDSGWFSASSRKSPVELAKMASPRLIPSNFPIGLHNSSNSSNYLAMSGNISNSHVTSSALRKNLSFTSLPSLNL